MKHVYANNTRTKRSMYPQTSGVVPFHVKASFGVVSSYIHIKYMYGNIFSLLKSGTMASLGPGWFLEEEGQPKNK